MLEISSDTEMLEKRNLILNLHVLMEEPHHQNVTQNLDYLYSIKVFTISITFEIFQKECILDIP